MPGQPIDPLQEEGTQRLVVLQLLRDDHDPKWTRVELEKELDDIDPDAIAIALQRLQEQGVVQADGEQLSASPCAWHLDALNFITI
jgi:hypothetical protein